MSGARFARAARCRFFVYISILVLMMGMLIIFHNSQLQLDEAKQQRLLCEQQQETLNDRLSSLVEQKFQLEKKREHEVAEQLQIKRNLGQRIKELEETMQNEKLQFQVHYEKLEQSQRQLESKHEDWMTDWSKAKVQQIHNTNNLEKQVHNLQSALRKGKSVESSEINLWKEQYNIVKEQNQNLNEELKNRTLEIDNINLVVKEYKEHCAYQPFFITTQVANMTLFFSDRAEETVKKSFHEQETITNGVYRVNISENVFKNMNVEQYSHISKNESATQQSDQLNQNSSLGSIGNIPIPKSGAFVNIKNLEQKQSKTRKSPSLPSVSPQNRSTNQKLIERLFVTGNNTSALDTNLGSMHSLLAAKLLPENVAPIPDNFEKLLDKSKGENILSPYEAELQLGKSQEPTEMDQKSKKMEKSLPSAQILVNGKIVKSGHDDEVLIPEGQNLQESLGDGNPSLLDKNSLHNEVAADQGKEFGENLRLDETDVDDGGDDDDYSNPSALKRKDQAVRN